MFKVAKNHEMIELDLCLSQSVDEPQFTSGLKAFLSTCGG